MLALVARRHDAPAIGQAVVAKSPLANQLQRGVDRRLAVHGVDLVQKQ